MTIYRNREAAPLNGEGMPVVEERKEEATLTHIDKATTPMDAGKRGKKPRKVQDTREFFEELGISECTTNRAGRRQKAETDPTPFPPVIPTVSPKHECIIEDSECKDEVKSRSIPEAEGLSKSWDSLSAFARTNLSRIGE